MVRRHTDTGTALLNVKLGGVTNYWLRRGSSDASPVLILRWLRRRESSIPAYVPTQWKLHLWTRAGTRRRTETPIGGGEFEGTVGDSHIKRVFGWFNDADAR